MKVKQAEKLIRETGEAASDYELALLTLIRELQDRLKPAAGPVLPACSTHLLPAAGLTPRARSLRAALIEMRYEPVIAALQNALEALPLHEMETAEQGLQDVIEAFTGRRPN